MIRNMEPTSQMRDEGDGVKVYMVTTHVTLINGETFDVPTFWTNGDVDSIKGEEAMSLMIQTLIENTIHSISDMAEFRSHGLVV